jgi:hypothetical protein
MTREVDFRLSDEHHGLKTVKHADLLPLRAAQKKIELGLRIPTPNEVEKAREVMKGSKLFPRMSCSRS